MADARIEELKFLIVDDSRVMIKLLLTMLGTAGVTDIDSASDAAEAEEKMKHKRYDVVFLDWRMSGKSGVALLEQCRSDRYYDNIALVVVSGESGQRYISSAMKSGATLYIIKPFSAQALQGSLDRIIKWLDERGRFAKPIDSCK